MILIIFILLILPIIISQFENLLILGPKFAVEVKNFISFVIEKYNLNLEVNNNHLMTLFNNFFKNFANSGINLVSSGLSFVSSILNIFMILILSFYILLELKNIKLFFSKLTNDTKFDFFISLLDEINYNLSKYFRGQALVCFILSSYYALTLFLISLEFGFLLGIFIGIISIIPYIGAFLGFFVAILLGVSQFGLDINFLFIILIFVFGQTFESYYLTPKLIGEAVKLNPVWIIFSLSCGGHFFGISGIIVAIPIAAIIGVIVRFWLKNVFLKEK